MLVRIDLYNASLNCEQFPYVSQGIGAEAELIFNLIPLRTQGFTLSIFHFPVWECKMILKLAAGLFLLLK